MAASVGGMKARVGVCLLMAVQFTQSLVTPGLAAMQESFPNAPTELVQSLSTVATLFMFASIFVGFGLRKIGYRNMTILTVVLMFLGAVGVAAIGSASFWGVFVSRMVYGVGYGFAFALCVAYCAALYEGKDRSLMLGIMTGVGGLASIIFGLVAGVLSEINWTYSFWFMAAFVAVFGIVCLVLLPEPKKSDAVAETSESTESAPQGAKTGYTFGFWFMIIVAMFGIAAFTSFMNNAAMVVIGTGMGDGAVVGTIFSVMGVGMMIGSFVYGPIKIALKKFTHPVILILFAIVFAGLLFGGSLVSFYIFTAVFGFTFGMLNPCWEDLLLDKAPGKGETVSSIFIATQGVGQFFSPMLLGYLATGIGLTGVYYQWQLAWPCMCVGAIAVLIVNLVSRRKPSQPSELDSKELDSQ